MTITMTFANYEEVVEFARKIAAEQKVPAGEKEIDVVQESKKITKKETVKEEPKETEEEQSYTLEDVRATLGALQKAGKKEQVRAMLQEFGAAKLPEVDPSDYPALMKKAGELNA